MLVEPQRGNENISQNSEKMLLSKRHLGPENPSKFQFRSGGVPRPRHTSVDEMSDRITKYESGTLARGFHPLQGPSDTTTDDYTIISILQLTIDVSSQRIMPPAPSTTKSTDQHKTFASVISFDAVSSIHWTCPKPVMGRLHRGTYFCFLLVDQCRLTCVDKAEKMFRPTILQV